MDFPAGGGLLPNFLPLYLEMPGGHLHDTLGVVSEWRVYYKMSRFAMAEMKQEIRERFEKDLWELT